MNIIKENDSINQYVELVGDLLKNDVVDTMKQYRHHGDINTHYHSVYVSYTVMKMCNRTKRVDTRETVRAALLHDFYLYEWYTEKHEEKHAWYHPKEAVRNIEKYFGGLTDVQRDMILKHMWPLILTPPKYLEGWILTAADKKCATEDIFKRSGRFKPVYDEICERVNKL